MQAAQPVESLASQLWCTAFASLLASPKSVMNAELTCAIV